MPKLSLSRTNIEQLSGVTVLLDGTIRNENDEILYTLTPESLEEVRFCKPNIVHWNRNKCYCCFRPLKTEMAKLLGYGPECAKADPNSKDKKEWDKGANIYYYELCKLESSGWKEWCFQTAQRHENGAHECESCKLDATE